MPSRFFHQARNRMSLYAERLNRLVILRAEAPPYFICAGPCRPILYPVIMDGLFAVVIRFEIFLF